MSTPVDQLEVSSSVESKMSASSPSLPSQVSEPSKNNTVIETSSTKGDSSFPKTQFKKCTFSKFVRRRQLASNSDLEEAATCGVLPLVKKANYLPVGLDTGLAESELSTPFQETSVNFFNLGTGAFRSGPVDQGATSVALDQLSQDAPSSSSKQLVSHSKPFSNSLGVTSQRQQATGERKSISRFNEQPDSNSSSYFIDTKSSEQANMSLIYHGEKARTQYIKQSKYSGPMPSSLKNVRCDIITDYARDICKDYKETGYCGYGDSCKFLHDRSDYKSGWQIDRDWDAQEQSKRLKAAKLLYKGVNSSEEKQGEQGESGSDQYKKLKMMTPFACHLCRKPFQNPVMTPCGHYFCEDCALGYYQKDPSCSICKEPTRGIFNAAQDILKRKRLELDAQKELDEEQGRRANRLEDAAPTIEIDG